MKSILNKPGDLLAKKKEIDAKLPNYAKNSEENMKKHLENTGGKYRTRFHRTERRVFAHRARLRPCILTLVWQS